MVLLIVGAIVMISHPKKKELQTMVGEIVYIKHEKSSVNTNDPNSEVPLNYYIYVRIPNCELLELFTVSEATATESDFSNSVENMPELSIGNVVEITYFDERISRGAYQAESIKTSTLEEQMTLEATYNVDENYRNASTGARDVGTVVYIGKISYPLNGYVIYLDDAYSTAYTLSCYVIDEKTVMPDDMRELLESQSVGYRVSVSCVDANPFCINNYWFGYWVHYMELSNK